MSKCYIFCLFAGFLLASSCTKKNDQPANNTHYPLMAFPVDTPGNAVTINRYPLATGNSWTYTVATQWYTAHDTSAVATYEFTIKIASDSIMNGVLVYKVTSTRSDELFMSDDNSEHFPSYYLQTGSALYHIADIAGISPAVIPDQFVVLKYEQPPWSYTENTGFRANKSTGGYCRVTTPAGIFDCLKVNTLSHFGSLSKETTQYYADKGLIRQTQFYDYSTSTGGVTTVLKVMTLKSVNF